MTEFQECRRVNVSENPVLYMKAAFADTLLGQSNVPRLRVSLSLVRQGSAERVA